MSSKETREWGRIFSLMRAHGLVVGSFLTMILYRGADIVEKDRIPAGPKNWIVFPLK